jgi:hypothetical protein
MSTATVTDARRTMREALHRLVSDADDWSRPSLAVFRNRLLDEVGSDARPLANLLIEAIERGVVDSLPRTSMPPALWSAKSTPLVMRWVNDRFLQPEVARWAVEAWGYALGCIDISQLTAAVDAPEPEPLTPQWPVRRPEQAMPAGAVPGRTTARAPIAAPPSTGTTAPWRGTYAPPSGATRATTWTPPSRVSGSAASNWAVANATRVALGTAAIAVSSYIYIFASAASRQDSASARAAEMAAPVAPASANALADRTDANVVGVNAAGASVGVSDASGAEIPTTYTVAEPSRSVLSARITTDARALSAGIGVGGQATVVPMAAGSGGAISLAMTRLPAEGATPNAYLELAARSNARALSRGDSAGTPLLPPSVSPLAPGVPGVTRNALPVQGGDASRARRVSPAVRPAPRLDGVAPTASASATRAVAANANAANAPAPPTTRTLAPSVSAPVSAANANSAATPGLDQLRLLSGRRITGRTEVIQVSSVVFRDAETGLRYEFAKDDIDEIITEFGSAVRFRQRAGSAVRSVNDRRAVSVGGRYAVTYEAARVNGSPACRDLWRGPSGADAATVRHRAGDDTLSVAFAGGDTFPSVMDADGFFASTFRIMQGQEQIATALTTRLNGRFSEDGTLAVQVTVIGYRRVQGAKGVACEITVEARGTRSP